MLAGDKEEISWWKSRIERRTASETRVMCVSESI